MLGLDKLLITFVLKLIPQCSHKDFVTPFCQSFTGRCDNQEARTSKSNKSLLLSSYTFKRTDFNSSLSYPVTLCYQVGVHTNHKANEVQPRFFIMCMQYASERLTEFILAITFQMPCLKQTDFLKLHNNAGQLFPQNFQGFIPLVIAQTNIVVSTNEQTSTVTGRGKSNWYVS